MSETSNEVKILRALRDYVEASIPESVHNQLRDALFSATGGWDKSYGFCTHTAPALIALLQGKSVDDAYLLAIEGAAEDGTVAVPFVWLPDGTRVFIHDSLLTGDNVILCHANISTEAKTLSIANVKKVTVYDSLSVQPVTLSTLNVETVAIRTLKDGMLESIASGAGETTKLKKVEVAQLDVNLGRIPSLEDASDGVELNLQQAGITTEQAKVLRGASLDYPFGIDEVKGRIVCTDGTITF